MKVILNYGRYFNYGKCYQAKFHFEDEIEAKEVSEYIEGLKERNSINPVYEKFSKKKEINIIERTNIKKEMLLPFVKGLIEKFNGEIVIRNQEFTTFDVDCIKNAIDRLHINVTLNKGDYFSIPNTYYVIFSYANDEQRAEISYDFNCRLRYMLGEKFEAGIWPFSINNKGKMATHNSGIIGGTNIPVELLPYFIKRFIEEYDMVVNIDDVKFKNKFDEDMFQESLLTLEQNPGRSRTKKKKMA